MLLHRAGVVAARLLKRDRHRAAGIGGVRTDAHGDRPAGVTLDHPARRDEHPRGEREQQRQEQQDAGSAKGGEQAHAPRLMARLRDWQADRSEEHTSELQSLMRISYAVFCLTKTHKDSPTTTYTRLPTTTHARCK